MQLTSDQPSTPAEHATYTQGYTAGRTAFRTGQPFDTCNPAWGYPDGWNAAQNEADERYGPALAYTLNEAPGGIAAHEKAHPAEEAQWCVGNSRAWIVFDIRPGRAACACGHSLYLASAEQTAAHGHGTYYEVWLHDVNNRQMCPAYECALCGGQHG